MLRLLDFISREEHHDDRLALSAGHAQHLAHHAERPASPRSPKRAAHVVSIPSDLTDNQPLTDAIINQTSQLTISSADQRHHSPSQPHAYETRRLSDTPSTVQPHQQLTPHPTNFSEQPQGPISSHTPVVPLVKPAQSQHASARHLRTTPSTSPQQRLWQVVHHLNTFAQLDAQPHGDAEGPPCSFEQLQNALSHLAQLMVWADQHHPSLWDLFLELGTMPLLVRCLRTSQQLEAWQRASLAHGTAHSTHSEHALTGNTTDASERANVADVTQLVRKNKSFVYHNKAEVEHETETASAASQAEHKQLDEGHTASTQTEQRANASSTQHAVMIDLHQFVPAKVQSQVLQAISIMVQSVSRPHSLLCLFASGHINDVLSFDFAFDEEMIAAFISTVKTITIRLDRHLLQLFFDPVRNSFPLYDTVTKFYGHHESMVRIAVRNITLAIYAIGDAEALKYAARDENNYFVNTIQFLSGVCGSVARAFELLLDDGREVRRTRTRTGIFRRKVRVSDVTDRLEEIENICSYLNDVCIISSDVLCPVLVRLTSARFISPFFRPLASLASPDAVRARNKLWRLGSRQKKSSHKTALAIFDAAARCLLLSCILKSFRSSAMSESVTRELQRVCNEFDRRSILHALKAMASDIAGTERVTFVALCAIEAFIECKRVEKHFLHDFKYDFRVEDPSRSADGQISPRLSFLDLEAPHQDDLERSHDEPMLMTLSEFEAPLTPSNSLPSTPDLKTASSDGTITPTILSRATSSASLSSELSTSIAERTDSEGILFSFQMGEATLREALSSIVLVVRRREARSMRVLYAISRIMAAIGTKTQERGLCVEVCKIMLDELAGLMQSVLRDKQTTIVCIERMFESFRTAASSKQGMYSDAPKLDDVLSPDRVPLMASMFPKGAGKRRRAMSDDAIVPSEIEDADAFFVMMYAYEKALADAGITTLPKLVLQAQGILLEYDLPDSYLDKRDALVSFAEAVLQHGEIE